MTSAKRILSKTIPCILAKLALGGASVAIALVVLVLWLNLEIKTGAFAEGILFVLWVLSTGATAYFIMHILGYKAKAGHIAVAAEAAGTDRIPDDQLNWSSRHVKQLYPDHRRYFAAKKRISRAIREIQSCFGRADIWSSAVSGRSVVPAVTETLLMRFMRYMDGCCIGWIFLRRRQDMNKSSAEGIAIYVQNRKFLLSNSIKIMTKAIIYAAAVMLVAFLPIGMLCRVTGASLLAGLWLSFLCAWAVKYAVIDSYIMIRTVTNFTKAARRVAVTDEVCQEYSKMSDTYYMIWKKAQSAGL